MGHAPLERIDPTLDVLADHWNDCLGCGKPILDGQSWAKFSKTSMPEGRVHVGCWLQFGKVAIAQSYEDRITDQLNMPRVAIAPRSRGN